MRVPVFVLLLISCYQVTAQVVVCPKGEFQCNDQLCISQAKVCDGIEDCMDVSDEMQDCACSSTQRRCPKNKLCISSAKWCDKNNDCLDWADEINCPYRICSPGEIQCPEQCLPASYGCDGFTDCTNGADEMLSSCNCTGKQLCDNGLCLNPTLFCNGKADCSDGSDEVNCTCPVGERFCGDNCLGESYFCDGYEDCLDWSDEIDCPCSAGFVKCSNKRCTPQNTICDGDNDCGDNSDEEEPLCTYRQQVNSIMYNTTDILLPEVTCATDNDCTHISLFAVCDKIESVGTKWRCVCDFEQGFIKDNNVCLYGSSIEERCDDSMTVCTTLHSECRYDGNNNGDMRCLCLYPYMKVIDQGEKKCGVHLSRQEDPACGLCESNDGLCYDTDGDGLRDGCLCTGANFGDNCEERHLNVTCDMGSFSMKICYLPHDRFDFTSGAIMEVEGKNGVPACKARTAQVADPDCSAGEQKLVLPLDPVGRQECGSTAIYTEVGTKRYQNMIVVRKAALAVTPEDMLTFNAFCSFKTLAETGLKPLGIRPEIHGEKGEHTLPLLSFVVEDHLGNSIQEGISIRLGDRLRFRIYLGNTEVYKALNVLRCQASSSHRIGSPDAVTLPLVLKSCPYAQQIHITTANNWAHPTGKTTEMATGFIRMFKLYKGNTVHIHCTVRLCLDTTNSACHPVSCSGLRKRSVSSSGAGDDTSVLVSGRLHWFSDNMLENNEHEHSGKPDPKHWTSSQVCTCDAAFWIMPTCNLIFTFMFLLVSVISFRLLTRKTQFLLKEMHRKFGMPFEPMVLNSMASYADSHHNRQGKHLNPDYAVFRPQHA